MSYTYTSRYIILSFCYRRNNEMLGLEFTKLVNAKNELSLVYQAFETWQSP